MLQSGRDPELRAALARCSDFRNQLAAALARDGVHDPTATAAALAAALDGLFLHAVVDDQLNVAAAATACSTSPTLRSGEPPVGAHPDGRVAAASASVAAPDLRGPAVTVAPSPSRPCGTQERAESTARGRARRGARLARSGAKRERERAAVGGSLERVSML